MCRLDAVIRRMYIKLHRPYAMRIAYILLFLLACTILLVQWQFHTFTTLIQKDKIRELGGLTMHGHADPTSLVIEKLRGDQESNKKVIDSLNHQIADLKELLKTKVNQLEKMEKLKEGSDSGLTFVDIGVYPDADKISHYLRNQVENAHIIKPHQYRNEYDIPPFSSFTRTHVYHLDLELVKQPQMAMNFHQDIDKDLKEVIEAGDKVVDDENMDFVEGYFRTQAQSGTQYELVYRSKVNTSAPFRVVTLFRPFAPLHMISAPKKSATETVHVIVPLEGRPEAFRKFMDNFEPMAITSDGHIHLTVVCYGYNAINETKAVLAEVEERTGFKDYQVVPELSGSFARGRALQEGTSVLSAENPLMFFCDVDMFFTTHFLSQCRSHTMPGRRVFYPIVFSLYNPEIVYKDKPVPSLSEQQVIKRENGFWRDFGFGMTCQYKKDFQQIGGFDLTIKGWGSEDVLLYRKYSRSPDFQVVRTPVHTLFHHWHPKHCDKSLSLEQYNACLRTRSLTEGSQIQLGMLYLKDKAEND